MFKVDTSELKKLAKDMHDAVPLIKHEFIREIETSADMVKSNYRREARQHMDTGDLDRSIDSTRVGEMTWEVGSTKDYSWFLEGGTREHKIPLVPKDENSVPRFLAFFWEKIGTMMYAEQVTHPGTRAFNLLFNSYTPVFEPFPQTFGKRVINRMKTIKKI